MTTAGDQKARIDIALGELARDTAMEHGQREAVSDMLISAQHACNGSVDKIQAVADAVGAVSVFLARKERADGERFAALLSAHERACPMRSGPTGKLSAVYAFRWPLAIVLAVGMLSPYVGPVAAKIIEERANRDMPAVQAVQSAHEGHAGR